MNKLLKWLNAAKLGIGVGLLATLTIVGCGGGSSAPAPAPAPTPTYSLSGTVSGAVTSGVTVSLSGAATATTTTDASGKYSFASLSNGSYTVTPSKVGFTFSPSSSAATISGANVTGKNFTASASAVATTYTISGTTGSLAGVTLNLSGSATASVVSTAGGAYTFSNVANGSYTVVPSLAGYTFAPSSASVMVNNGNATVANFVPSVIVVSHLISGTITGSVVSGVAVGLAGDATRNTTTAANGTYSFTGLADGNYTVTPSSVGHSFSPTSLAVTLSGANATAKNFVASANAATTYTLSGTTGTTNGVTVTLNTGASTTTSGGGNYSFASLVAGNYTVTPSFAGYTFAPVSRSVTISNVSVVVPNFVPTPPATTYNISGVISGTATSGVSLALTSTGGTAKPAVISGVGGAYSFTGLSNATYTVTPTLSGKTFSPLSQQAVVNNGPVSALNFTASDTVAPTYMVSGTVTGPWVEGLSIDLKQGATLIGTAVTNASGNYSFSNVLANTYTLTPKPLAGYTYVPQTATVVGATTVFPIVATAVNSTVGISGMVTYGGAQTGAVRVSVYWPGNIYPITSQTIQLAAGSGTYNIQGGLNGNLEVRAEMDVLGNGSSNASNPISLAVPVTMAGVNQSNVNLTLADVATVTPVAMTNPPSVSPGSGAVFVQHDFPTNIFGTEIAKQYKLYWGTSPDALTGGGSKLVTAPGANNGSPIILTGLVNGTALYFKMSALVGAVESAPSPVTGPITVGAGVGGSTVSGTVSSPGLTIPPSAKLLVGVYSNTGIYFSTIAAPSNAEAFSVTGVPAGNYFHFAVIDMNANGLIDAGDISNTNGNAPSLTVGATGTVVSNLTLNTGVSSLAVPTSYSAQWNGYDLRVRASDGTKHIVAVKLVSGANVALPADLSTGNGNDARVNFVGAAIPVVGDTYGFKVTYSDGTSELRNASVTGVLGASNVATGLTVNTTAGGASNTAPLFSWLAPAVAPAGQYQYNINLYGTNSSGNWWQGGMPSTQLSALYNENGNANNLPSLVVNVPYTWRVEVVDANGNIAGSAEPTYTPVAPLPVALSPAAALASYLAEVTSVQGVAEIFATGANAPNLVVSNRRWVQAGVGVYTQSPTVVKELTGNTWSAALTAATQTFPAYYMNANATAWTIPDGSLSWTVDTVNNIIATTHPRTGALSMTINASDLSGTNIYDRLSGAGTTPIGTYPPGSIGYTQTGATSSLAAFRIFVDPWHLVTDVNGVALATAPTLGTTFCTQGVLMRPLVTPLAGGENYQAFMANGGCNAGSIAAATVLAANVIVGPMVPLNAGAPVVLGVTGPALSPFKNTIVATVLHGVYSGQFQNSGKVLNLIVDKNRMATNAELNAHGFASLP